MSIVYRKEKKYLRYSEWQTHTGAHRKVEWTDDLQMATVFHVPPNRVQAYMLQDAEVLPAKETRLITLLGGGTVSIDEVMRVANDFGFSPLLRHVIEQHVAEAVERETERLRGALLTLANAADDVGVQFFDMEDPPISVAQMESATLAARAALAALQETK